MPLKIEIGGYFGLDLPEFGGRTPHPEAILYQSARAAVRAALSCNTFTRVLAPSYVCDSVIKAAQDAGLAVEIYALDDFLRPTNLPEPFPTGCAFLYVNYFGMCQQHVLRLVEQLPPGVAIIDNSHALFAAPHPDALATIYSPRKFVGLPDGGLLVASSRLRIVAPAAEDQGSIERMRYLLRRMAYSAREGYEDFQIARRSLADNTPLAMSRLTRRLMKSICWDEVCRRRRENFAAMATMLDHANDHSWSLGEANAPLCYPFTRRGLQADSIRRDLAADDIFTATYWPDALPRTRAGSIEATMINETLFLPIDQRLQRVQVEAVAARVLELTGSR